MEETDASVVAAGAVLAQKKKDRKIHTIQYSNRVTKFAEHKYLACEQEASVVISALQNLGFPFFSTEPFVLLSDQEALKAAFARKSIPGRLARGLNFPAEYYFRLRYRKGDSKSRRTFYCA